MGVSDSQMNLNIINIASGNRRVNVSLPTDNSNSASNVQMVRKQELTQEQKQQMELLNMDPTDSAKVAEFLAKTPEEIQTLLATAEEQILCSNSENQILSEEPVNETEEETLNEVSVPTSDVTETAKKHVSTLELSAPSIKAEMPSVDDIIIPEKINSVLQKISNVVINTLQSSNDSSTENNKIQIKPFIIDINSDEWKDLTPERRIRKFIMKATEAQYSEEEWASLDREGKKKAAEAFTNSVLDSLVPGFSKKSMSEQLMIGSELIDMVGIASDSGMSIEELMSIKENSPEKFRQISEIYFENNSHIDLSGFVQKRMESRLNDLKADFEAYARERGMALNSQNTYALLSEFLGQKSLDKKYRSIKLHIGSAVELLSSIAKRDENGNMISGSKSFQELISDEELITDSEGNPDYRNQKNIEKIMGKFVAEINSCKTPEERLAVFQSYDQLAQLMIMCTYTHSSYSAADSDNYMKFIEDMQGGKLFFAAVDETSTDGAKTRSAGMYNEALDWCPDEAIRRLKEPNFYNKDQAALAEYSVVKGGNKEKMYKTAEGINSRDDRDDVWQSADNNILNDNTIDEENKSYYAESSVATLNNDADRQKRANDLKNYNYDPFNSGANRGLEAPLRGNNSSSSSNSSSSTSQTPTTNYAQNSVVNYSSATKEEKAAMQKVDFLFNSELSDSEKRKEFDNLDPAEKDRILRNLDPNMLVKMSGGSIKSLCEAYPFLIEAFVQAGKGQEILSSSVSKVFDETVKLMKKHDPKDLIKFMVEHPAQFNSNTNAWASKISGKDKTIQHNPISFRA